MPKFLEEKLRAEYGANSKVPYKVMNAIGAMHGNKETAKGREMERKHEMKYKHTMITHHSDGSHTVEHQPMPKLSKSGAHSMMGEAHSYSVGSGPELMSKLHKHLSIPGKPRDGEAAASQAEDNEMGGEPMGEES